MSIKPLQMCLQITKDLRALENQTNLPSAYKIKIPLQVIRRMNEILPNYSFVTNTTIRRNICYAEEALDFYRWILRRFYTYGPIRGYIYKIGIILADMIVEAMVHDFLKQNNVKPNKKHSKNISKLARFGITRRLVQRAEALHNRRSNIHLHLVSDLEATKYKVKDWHKSMKCLHDIRKKLKELLI